MKATLTSFGVPSPLIAGKQTFDQAKEEALKESLAELTEKMNKKKPFVLTFSRADKDGNLEAYNEHGFKFVLPNEEIVGGQRYDSRFRAQKLYYNYEVVITDINEATKVITVSYAQIRDIQREKVLGKINYNLRIFRDERNEINKAAQEAVDKQMNEGLSEIVSGLQGKTRSRLKSQLVHEKNNELLDESSVERIVVPVLVKKVTRDEAYVDIMGYSIPGILPKFYWAHTHIDDFRLVLKEGTIVDIEVIGKDKNYKQYYMCARTPLVEDPWKHLDMEVGDIIRVTAIGTKQNHWFGMLDNCDIQVFCEFPDKGSGYEIIVGEQYECRIYKKKVETRLLKARPFRHVENRRR